MDRLEKSDRASMRYQTERAIDELLAQFDIKRDDLAKVDLELRKSAAKAVTEYIYRAYRVNHCG